MYAMFNEALMLIGRQKSHDFGVSVYFLRGMVGEGGGGGAFCLLKSRFS